MNTETFFKALGEVSGSYVEEAIRYKKKPRNRRLAKWAALAACLATLLAAGSLLMPSPGNHAVSVYAHGTGEEITAAGAVISTGTISDSGEMKGKPLMFYLAGKDISTVRFSCKNQELYFMDWTEKREEYGNARNFTVAYGEDESEYYYLTIDWDPGTIIRELTGNPSSSIAGLPEDMRRDIIVLEITFADGGTATKAVQVSLLDDGTFFASFGNYEISPEDTFVKRPDAQPVPRDILYAQGSGTAGIADAPPMIYVNGILYRQSLQQVCFEEKKKEFVYLGKIQSDVPNGQDTMGSIAQDSAGGIGEGSQNGVPKENFQANHPIVGAEVYQYQKDIVVLVNGKYWLYEALAGESAPPSGQDIQNGLTEEGNLQLGLAAAEDAARAYYAGTVFEVVSLELESHEGNTLVFSVSVKKGGVAQEPARRITLQQDQGAWEVANEGY